MRIIYWGFLVFAFSVFTSCLPKKELTANQSQSAETPIKKPSGSTANTPQVGKDYIKRYKTIAIEEMNKHGIPASIKLAQGMLESGNGNSRLALEANNHFGIKCTPEWTGGKINHHDDRPDDCFRIYQNAEDSFRDHSAFLLRKRYEKLFSLDIKDYKGWAKGLKEAGYATNPRYADLLISLIERYELYQYDSPQLLDHTISTESISTSESNSIHSNAAPFKSAPIMTLHEVAQGETLATIAAKYGLSSDRLVTINNLKSRDLHVGQLLVVSD